MSATVFLLGGTSESRDAARVALSLGFTVVASVVTPAARRLYDGLPGVTVRTGALLRPALLDAVRGADVILDATHPFATSISATAMSVAAEAGIRYVRFERPAISGPSDRVAVHADVESLLASGTLRGRRVLLAVGTKLLPRFTKTDAWARVLEAPESREAARRAGFPADRILASRLPVPEAEERALWLRLGIEAVVAKASGPAGGEDVKRRLAAELGVALHLLARPAMAYPEVAANEEDLERLLNSLEVTPCPRP